MNIIGLKTTLTFIILIAISCKKEELEIPVFKVPTVDTLLPVVRQPSHYFTFLSDKNEFTYQEKYTVQNTLDLLDPPKITIDTFTISVSSPGNHYYATSKILPGLASQNWYADSILMGTNLYDTLLTKFSDQDERKRSKSFDRSGWLYTIKKDTIVYRNTMTTRYILNMDVSYTGLGGNPYSKTIHLSPKYGVLSVSTSSSDDIRNESSSYEYLLISTNF